MNSELQANNATPWQTLRRYTPARVALGRSGGSMPTSALLGLRLAHARARDALLRPLDEEKLVRDLEQAYSGEVVLLQSAAPTFNDYLLRPDLGRLLSPESAEALQSHQLQPDLVIVVSEGLSTLAVESHAAPVIAVLAPALRADGWSLAPLCLVRRSRVAVQDHVGECLGAQFALILLGERPGLVSPDSLGAYLVRAPKRGNTDAQRNCISNINRLGLSPQEAAARMLWLLNEARRSGVSGVRLKDRFDPRAQITNG